MFEGLQKKKLRIFCTMELFKNVVVSWKVIIFVVIVLWVSSIQFLYGSQALLLSQRDLLG